MLLFFLLAASLAAEPVRLIFDTDMGNDVDDALALAMIHALENRGEAKLLAVTITKDNRFAAPYVDLVNTFFGRGDLPVGVVKNGKTPGDSRMIQVPVERRRPDGSPVYPHDLKDGRQAPEAAGLLQRILAGEREGAVTIVQVGFSSNLARLLERGGRGLVERKVSLLVLMGGAFLNGKPEYNIKTDIPAAKRLFAEWPTPIVASGYEIGERIRYPAASIEKDFGYVEHHPVADAYRNYKPMPYDRETWDLTAVLQAVRPSRGYFLLSPPGEITVDGQGRTRFAARPGGRHRHMKLDPGEKTRVLKTMTELASSRPKL